MSDKETIKELKEIIEQYKSIIQMYRDMLAPKVWSLQPVLTQEEIDKLEK